MEENIFSPNYSADYREKENRERKEEEKIKSRVTTRVVAKNNVYTERIKNTEKKPTLNISPRKTPSKNFNRDIKIKSRYKESFYKFLLSLFVLAITFTGLLLIVHRFSYLREDVTPALSSNTVSSANYSEFLAPVVMHDPEPFSSPEKADKQMKISSSIWRCIMKNGTGKYKDYDERGLSLMPVEDIEDACQELFGPNHGVNFKERVFGSFYSIDENERNFHICAISNQNCYIPYIEEKKREDENKLRLTVGYVLREDNFFKDGPEKAQQPTPKKRMIYILRKNNNKGSYFVESVLNCN